jgi:hypothetical protein
MSTVVGVPCQNLFQDEGRGMEVLLPKAKVNTKEPIRVCEHDNGADGGSS